MTRRRMQGFGAEPFTRQTLTLDEVCQILRMSRSTAKRLMAAQQFPIPPLPRAFHHHYRFAAAKVERYLERAEDGVVLSVPRRSA